MTQVKKNVSNSDFIDAMLTVRNHSCILWYDNTFTYADEYEKIIRAANEFKKAVEKYCEVVGI